MKELNKLIATIGGMALSVWLLAMVILNPALAASVAIKVFLGSIVFTVGAAIYESLSNGR